MKVVITGATGFVGSAVLKQCINDARITSIIVLSRRELPTDLADNSKIKVIIQKDFLQYPEDLLTELSGAEACLWALGGKASDFADVETAKKVQVDYTIAAANAFTERLLPAAEGKIFKFVFCSGAMAARDQSKSLWLMGDTRKIKGLVESGLIEISEKFAKFKCYIVRPGGILPEKTGFGMAAMGAMIPLVKVNELAIVMVEIAVEGFQAQTLENSEIVTKYRTITK